ncbi:MAG: TonB-dependent receptor plug domain-containing protein, partial [Acidobacteria bacterium]|nr:TonB-dependent receptor plug domain-containing protein [Acidobacteriota bacterium]
MITSITVSEKITAEAPGAVVRLDAGSVESRPGINLDDRLRDVPGFTLFRRTSSLVANPGTQGVSLRGLGPSGASRTLVLLDGIPVNDPFGGWVYWTRFNPDTIERIEISRGASTSVFGDRAMGGVVSLLTPTPRTRYFGAAFEGGNAGVRDAKGTYSDLFGAFGVSAFTRIFSSEGYYIVPESVRGKVDQKAGVDYVVGDLKLDYFSKAQRLSLKTNLLAEERNNGTAVQQNSTSLGTIGLHYSRERLSLSVY